MDPVPAVDDQLQQIMVDLGEEGWL